MPSAAAVSPTQAAQASTDVASEPQAPVQKDDNNAVRKRRRRWAIALSVVAVLAGAAVGTGLALSGDSGSEGPSGGSTGIVLSFR